MRSYFITRFPLESLTVCSNVKSVSEQEDTLEDILEIQVWLILRQGHDD